MDRPAPIQQLLHRSRRIPLLVIGLTLLILAGTILVARQQLRAKVRDQIIRRDGEVLHAVAQMHLDEFAPSDVAPDLGQQLTVVLKTSRLRGVLGARLFDLQGRFVEAFDADVLEANLIPSDLTVLAQLQPVSRFHRAVRLSENFWRSKSSDATGPLLEVIVPLHTRKGERLLGIAQFLIEGQSIAGDFDRLDRHLTLQALAAFGVSGAILIGGLGWAFGRLRKAHDLLAGRTGELLRANQEIALAARTSAVGAVSAHLIHGLKNPLSGLQNFVSNRGAADLGERGEEWEQAVASTRRMQSMINEIVNVLHEEEGGARYELSVAELAELVASRVQPLARTAGVNFVVHCDAQAILPNRAANLIALILVNLAQNGLQATPAGKSVSLRVTRAKEDLACEILDQGPGIPEELKRNLFAPHRSTKEGGAGIGLAISKQLANHLGAILELKSSGAHGSVFALSFPLNLGSEKIPMAISARE